MTEFHPTFEYDPSADALVVKLQPADQIARTVEVDDSHLVDVNEAGEVVEIEVLWASSGVTFEDLIDRFAASSSRKRVSCHSRSFVYS